MSTPKVIVGDWNVSFGMPTLEWDLAARRAGWSIPDHHHAVPRDRDLSREFEPNEFEIVCNEALHEERRRSAGRPPALSVHDVEQARIDYWISGERISDLMRRYGFGSSGPFWKMLHGRSYWWV